MSCREQVNCRGEAVHRLIELLRATQALKIFCQRVLQFDLFAFALQNAGESFDELSALSLKAGHLCEHRLHLSTMIGPLRLGFFEQLHQFLFALGIALLEALTRSRQRLFPQLGMRLQSLFALLL